VTRSLLALLVYGWCISDIACGTMACCLCVHELVLLSCALYSSHRQDRVRSSAPAPRFFSGKCCTFVRSDPNNKFQMFVLPVSNTLYIVRNKIAGYHIPIPVHNLRMVRCRIWMLVTVWLQRWPPHRLAWVLPGRSC